MVHWIRQIEFDSIIMKLDSNCIHSFRK
jgi:hypothetical protein